MGRVTTSNTLTVSTLHRVFAGRLVAPALLVTAGLIFATDAQGLVSVLVVLAASGTAIRSGRRTGVVLAATAGLGFIAVSVWQERATGIGLPLTAAVVLTVDADRLGRGGNRG